MPKKGKSNKRVRSPSPIDIARDNLLKTFDKKWIKDVKDKNVTQMKYYVKKYNKDVFDKYVGEKGRDNWIKLCKITHRTCCNEIHEAELLSQFSKKQKLDIEDISDDSDTDGGIIEDKGKGIEEKDKDNVPGGGEIIDDDVVLNEGKKVGKEPKKLVRFGNVKVGNNNDNSNNANSTNTDTNNNGNILINPTQFGSMVATAAAEAAMKVIENEKKKSKNKDDDVCYIYIVIYTCCVVF